MDSYAVVPIAAVALLAVAGGTATLSRGWLPPWLRGRIFRPALFGGAQLALGAALAAQLAGGFLITSPDARLRLTMSGVAVMMLAVGLIAWAQHPRGHAGDTTG